MGRLGRDSPRRPREAMLKTEASIMRSACACLYGSRLGLCCHVGPSRAHVEQCWAHLWLMLGQAGPMLSHVGRILGLCWPRLGLCWAMLGPSWAHVGPMLACVGPMLAHVEPSWELCRGPVWAIYVETILRCQFFRPEPPPGARNHVKNDVF